MSGEWRAAGGRILGALGVAGLAVGLVDYAVAGPVARFAAIDRVTLDVALSAWMGPLSGMLTAAVAVGAWNVVKGPRLAWDYIAIASIWGIGLGAALAAIGLSGALMAFGPEDNANLSVIVPATCALAAFALLALKHAWLTRREDAWAGLAHVMWGGFGVLALCAGGPMLWAASDIPDAHTLVHRYNLLVVLYPLLWLAYVSLAAALTITGLRWIAFGIGSVSQIVLQRRDAQEVYDAQASTDTPELAQAA